MRLALIGYGKMGHAIEQIALTRGHSIAQKIDVALTAEAGSSLCCDVALEFTQPEAAVGNIIHCMEQGVPVVVGTTGWYDRLDYVKEKCKEYNGALFVASNFSIGMNVVFALNRRLATLLGSNSGYKVHLSETHHIHKLDAPSGTAITLADDINRISGDASRMPVADIVSVREGEVAGIHEVVYDSDYDTITLRHSAKDRRGLALGAVMAAEFLAGKQGFYTMDDLLQGNEGQKATR